MKIILLKDVPKLGRKYDIKEASDGYALNFLIPRKLAERATPEKIAQIDKLKKEMLIAKEAGEQELLKALGAIKGLELIMKAKVSDLPARLADSPRFAGEAGAPAKRAGKVGKAHLFSSIKKEDIIEKMKKDYNIILSEDSIKIESIKEAGEFEIPVEVAGKKSSFKLIVEKID